MSAIFTNPYPELTCKITSGELVYDLRRSNGDWNLITLYIFILLTINLLPYIDSN
ncbi:hypothetical protein [Candidatus Tisiphia endosymbiont of Micropterix aruncella]|uniref:hypothetical protein n=1 Tax=Candidatus Tisiphia endosymbiont of Micropterix aruncella TaxID=3066271 RepID=UPI003AA891AE